MRRLLSAFATLLLATAASAAPLVVGYSDWPGYTIWELGKTQGFFKKHGCEIELKWFPVYTDSLTALNTGQLDGNLQTWNDLMAPLAEGVDLKTVLVLDNSFGNDAIMAKTGIGSVKDLKGKTVATELGTCDHYLLLKGLASAGLSEKDVKYTNLTVPDAAAAFIAGKVDAAAIWQPWISQIQREGKGTVVYSSADIPGLIPDILAVQGKVAKERAADVQKCVASYFDMVAFLKSNTKEAVAVMAKVVEQPPDAYEAFLPGTKFFDLPMNLNAFEQRENDNTSLYSSGKAISEFLIQQGQLKKMPDYAAAIDPTFVKALAAGAK
jgi:NitT/TauT family transport system substrate-binding protein